MKNKLDSIFSHMQFVSERKQIALMAINCPEMRIKIIDKVVIHGNENFKDRRK